MKPTPDSEAFADQLAEQLLPPPDPGQTRQPQRDALFDRLRDESEAGLPAALPYPAFSWQRLAVAAAVLLVVAGGWWALPASRSHTSVAWAEVVSATRDLKQLRITAVTPLNGQQEVLEFFYRAPNQWRLHGFDEVVFATPDKVQAYDTETSQFRAPRRMEMPAEFFALIRDQGLVAGFIAMAFEDADAIPHGEPVLSARVSDDAGIDVFDYAVDAQRQWVRIWVLRASGLPLRMEVNQPEYDDTTLLIFDYTDPQPASFFDPTAFAQAARSLPSPHYGTLRNLNAAPAFGNKARSAGQLYTTRGGYKTPDIHHVWYHPDHPDRVLIQTNNPRNVGPNGSAPHQTFASVQDNWGNTYAPEAYGRYRNPSFDKWSWAYAAVPPFRNRQAQSGPRKLSADFNIDTTPYGQPETTLLLLDHEPLAGPANHRAWLNDAASALATAPFMPLPERARMLKQVGAATHDLGVLAAHHQALREAGREAEAWAFFESHLRDRLFNTTPRLLAHPLQRYEYLVGQYLLHLGRTAPPEQTAHWRSQAQKVVKNLLDHPELYDTNSARWRAPLASSLDHYVNQRLCLLQRVLHAPAWAQALEQNPPRIEEAVVDPEGRYAVRMTIPPPPDGWASDGWTHGAPQGWLWHPKGPIGARHLSEDRTSMWLVLSATSADNAFPAMSAEARLVTDNYGSGHPRHAVTWKWQAPLATLAPTRIKETAIEWMTADVTRAGETPKIQAPAPPQASPPAETPDTLRWKTYGKMTRAAKDKHWDETLALSRELLAEPQEPDGVTAHAQTGIQRSAFIQQIEALLGLDQAAAAQQALADFASRHGLKSLTNPIHQSALANRDALLKGWIRWAQHHAGESPAAAQEALKTLAPLEKLRTSRLLLPEGYVEAKPQRFNPRQIDAKTWRAFDRARWRLQDLAAGRVPASASTPRE